MSTTIKIGHASMSESGTAIGVAGDSTGKEVYIVSKYTAANISPYVVLRPNNLELATKSVAACIAGCTNNNIGYSQSTRNTLYNLAKAAKYNLATVGLCNTDCSAFMTVCALAGGANIDYGSNAPTTSNMKDRFTAYGDYTALTDSKYTTKTDYLIAGDILVSQAKGHTVMVLENGIEADMPDIPVVPEIPADLCLYSAVSKITSITKSSCSIEIDLVDQLNGASIAINGNTVKYFLEYKKLSDAAYKELSITNKKITLQNLTEDTCYIYRVRVTNLLENLFYSAYKTFTTTKTEVPTNKITKVETDGRVCMVYTRMGDTYSPATIHINT